MTWKIRIPKFAKNAGVDPKFPIVEAMVDFYMLERLEADGSKLAAKMMREHTQKTADLLSAYLALACAGELRHITRCLVDDEGYYGSREIDCRNAWCWEANCDNYHSDNRRCRTENQHKHTHYEETYHEGTSTEWEDYVSNPYLRKMLHRTEGGSDGRDGFWTRFARSYVRVGPSLLRDVARAFSDAPWDGGYGGELWANAARLTYDYLVGKIDARVFVNMAWSLEHNGGCILNKVWLGDEDWVCREVYGKYASHMTPAERVYYKKRTITTLGEMLIAQANDSYDRMCTYASPNVARMWNDRRYRISAKVVDAGAERIKLYDFFDRSPEWLGLVPDVGVAW